MKHQVVDQRSLELNRLIAEKIRRNPSLIQRGTEHINGYLSKLESSESGRQALLEWKQIIDSNSLEQTLAILTEESEEGQRLRQSSPFTGIITQEERAAIFAKYERFRACHEKSPAEFQL